MNLYKNLVLLFLFSANQISTNFAKRENTKIDQSGFSLKNLPAQTVKDKRVVDQDVIRQKVDVPSDSAGEKKANFEQISEFSSRFSQKKGTPIQKLQKRKEISHLREYKVSNEENGIIDTKTLKTSYPSDSTISITQTIDASSLEPSSSYFASTSYFSTEINSEITSSFNSLYTSTDLDFSSSTDFISELFTTEIPSFSETFFSEFISSDLLTTFEPETEIFTSEVLSLTAISSLETFSLESVSILSSIYQSSTITPLICDICPSLFLGNANDSACRSTFGIIFSLRGYTDVSSYTIDYLAHCIDNKTLTPSGLVVLADAQIGLIKEISSQFPSIFNIFNNTLFEILPEQNSFRLLFKIYSNSLFVLNLLYEELQLITRFQLNTSFCRSSFTLASRFIDIDECALRLDTCDSTKQCINTLGSFLCICKPGTISNLNNCTCQSTSCKCGGNEICIPFGGREFCYPVPDYNQYKVSTYVLIVLTTLLLLLSFALRICPFERWKSIWRLIWGL